ncbi:MAG: ArsR family transcriptional regulator [Rhodoglobus sp.]|nr:ArsR family transcriptional regulator [Rhodoglobus sp.]
MNAEQLSTWLTAIASPQRMRILATIADAPLHVSEIARRMEMSRALLYMHIAKLEEAGFVTGHHELTEDGKALKLFTAVPFSTTLDLATLVAAVAASSKESSE